MTTYYITFIDSGAFGNVYKISETGTDTIVLRETIKDEKNTCLKLCSVEDGSKEHEFLKKLNHKNVIKTYFGYFDIDIDTYIIALYLMSGDVYKYRKEIKIDMFINQMMSALQYIHSNNIIHCDIKPQNILFKKIANDQLFCLTDFNTAHIYKMNNTHMKFKKIEDDRIIGTINFCSLFVLLKCHPYKRDDLESLFITILFLANDDLDENIFTKEKNEKILRKFRLCMYEYNTIKQIRSYNFYESIDYKLIQSLLISDFL